MQFRNSILGGRGRLRFNVKVNAEVHPPPAPPVKGGVWDWGDRILGR